MVDVAAISNGGQNYPVNYRGNNAKNAEKVNISDVPDTFEKQSESPKVVIKEVKKKGGFWKGVFSAVTPGLGQLADGRIGPAAGYFLGCSLLPTATYFGTVFAAAKNPKLGLATGVLGGLATAGLWISNIVDAAKGGKDKKVD